MSLLNRPAVDIEKFINKGGSSIAENMLPTTSSTSAKKRGRPKR